jgi:hypothetical protein
MSTLIPSIIYVSRNGRTVGADPLSWQSVATPAPASTWRAPLLTTSTVNPTPVKPASSFSWSSIGKGLLDLGGTVATGFANLSLQKAQLKAQAEASRPIIYGGGGSGYVSPYGTTSAPASDNSKLLLYGGLALGVGLIAVVALRRK